MNWRFNNEKEEVVNVITKLGNKNVTTNELLKNIRNSTLNNATTKTQVENILKSVLKNSNLNPLAKEFNPSKSGLKP